MMSALRVAQPSVRLADPHDCTNSADALSILGAFFDTLVRREGAGHVPHLAEAWTMSRDCRRIDLRLRRGVTFCDGAPVDAAAACANLARMARPDKGHALGSAGVWHRYLGGAAIRPEGDLGLRIELAAPVADLLDVLAQAFVVAPGSFGALEAGAVGACHGSGPYRLLGMEEGSIRAGPRPGHFAAGTGRVAVEWQAVQGADARLARLADGRADVAMRLPRGGALPRGATDLWHDDPTAVVYLFNQAAGPLSDPRLRRALDCAVDRRALVAEVLGGAGVPLHGLVGAAHLGAVPAAPDPRDPALARRLLAEAGHGGGLRLSVDCPTRLPDEAERLTACLARQLAPFGVTLDVRLHGDREAYAHMVRRKQIGDMCVLNSSPTSTFRVIHEKLNSRVAGAWWQGHRSPALERMLDRARVTAAPGARAGIYREIHAEARRDPPWLALYTVRHRMGLRGATVPGMPPDGVLDVSRLRPLT